MITLLFVVLSDVLVEIPVMITMWLGLFLLPSLLASPVFLPEYGRFPGNRTRRSDTPVPLCFRALQCPVGNGVGLDHRRAAELQFVTRREQRRPVDVKVNEALFDSSTTRSSVCTEFVPSSKAVPGVRRSPSE